MESHKLSVKRILIDLLPIKDQLKMLFNNNTEYTTLINFLTEKDYYNNDNIPLPSLKEIQSKTGFKTNQLRNQLLNIYQELFEYDSDKTLEFNNKEYSSFLILIKHMPLLHSKALIIYLGLEKTLQFLF